MNSSGDGEQYTKPSPGSLNELMRQNNLLRAQLEQKEKRVRELEEKKQQERPESRDGKNNETSIDNLSSRSSSINNCCERLTIVIVGASGYLEFPLTTVCMLILSFGVS